MAYHNAEPELVGDIRDLVSNGTSRPDVVDIITSRKLKREEIEAAHTYWIRQMPRFAWDDHTGTRVLMVIEDVLRKTPR